MTSILINLALIIIGVLLFALIIFFHEGGHFLAAKKSGVQVNEFALGMGPKILSFVMGETRYSLRLLPIGGFCSMEGEDEESENPRAFTNANVWKRMIIIVAGAFMNIVLGIIMMFAIVVQQPNYDSTTVSGFTPDSYTANCGLQKGDKITRLNGYKVRNADDLKFALATTKVRTVDGKTIQIYRQDCTNSLYLLLVDIYTRENAPDQKTKEKAFDKLAEGVKKINKAKFKDEANALFEQYYTDIEKTVGDKDFKIPEITEKKTRQRFVADIEVERDGKNVTLKDVQFYTYLRNKDDKEPSIALDFSVEPIGKNFGSVISQTFGRTYSTARMVWSSLVGMFTGQFTFKDISGPVGATQAISTVASDGLKTSFLEAFNRILFMMMLISVNLGIFNMLPFPALDGGRFVLLIIEGVFHKPIPRKAETVINGVGLAILLLFMAVVTVKDVWMLTPFAK